MSRSIIIPLTTILILLHIHLLAQISVKRFEAKLNLPMGSVSSRVLATRDSGFCILGDKQFNGLSYTTLTRLDKYGNLLWAKNYHPLADSVSFNSCYVNTYDNGFVFATSVTKNWSTVVSHDTAVLIKVDSAGIVQWAKKYPYDNSSITNLCQLSDSGIAMALGYWVGNNYRTHLHKVDRNGNAVWFRKNGQLIWDVREAPNKHIRTMAPGASMIIKDFDLNGNDVWERKYSDTHWFFNGWAIDVNQYGETIFLSDLFDSTGAVLNGLYAMKADSLGNVLFSSEYSGNWQNGQVYAGGFTKDCGVIMNTRIYIQDPNYIQVQGMLKLDLAGNAQWLKRYSAGVDASSTWVAPTFDLGQVSLALIGASPFYARLIKTDVDGKTSCNNDSAIAVTRTNIPLNVDTTMHPSVAVALINMNIAILTATDTAAVTLPCSDNLMANPSIGCALNTSPSPSVNVCANKCAPLQVYTAGGVPPYTYSWTPAIGNGPGPYSVCPDSSTLYSYTVEDNNGTATTGSIMVAVTQGPPVAVSSGTACRGDSVMLVATGANSFTWSPATELSATNSAMVYAYPASSTSYTVTGSNAGSMCQANAVSQVTIYDLPIVKVNSATVCIGQPATLVASGAASYTWTSTSNLSGTNGTTIIVTPSQNSTYTVVALDTNGCRSKAEAEVHVLAGVSGKPNVFSPNGDGINDEFFITNNCYEKINLLIYDRWGEEMCHLTSLNETWNGTAHGKKCSEGTYYYVFEGQFSQGAIVREKGFLQLVR